MKREYERERENVKEGERERKRSNGRKNSIIFIENMKKVEGWRVIIGSKLL